MAVLLRWLAVGSAAALLTLIGLLLLPHDPYIRWQSVRDDAFARLGWIYERIHDDETPIDVAFIGTSHTMVGIDTPGLERQLDEAGIGGPGGRCLHLVNFAVPAYGRNLQWLVARELLEHRKVQKLVIEVFENESRMPHPLFLSVAEVGDVLTAPVLVNLNYVRDLVHLPGRQLRLFAESRWPAQWGLKPRFDAADYDGSDIDNSRVVNVGGVALTGLRDRVMPADQLAEAARRELADKRLHMLPGRLAAWEYAVPNRYLTAMLDLARAKGVEVIFLYLPGYGMPPAPFDETPYRGRGDMLFVNDVLRRPELWDDPAHLNWRGAEILTTRLAQMLGERWGTGAAAQVAALGGMATCSAGYPPRARLTPRPGLDATVAASID